MADAKTVKIRASLAIASTKGQPGRPRGKLTQLQKVTRLQQLLVQYPKGITIDEIAGHLQVDPRSARRYVKALRSELRTDLEPVTDGDGAKRWRIPDVDVPRRVAMRRTQAYALLAARPLFAGMRGSTVYEEIALASESLLGIARRPGRGPNGGLRGADLEQRFRYVSFAPKDYSERGEDLDNLFQAVADLRPIAFLYPSASAAFERVTVQPYALLLYKESIYALGLDVALQRVRTFELDFVRDSRLLADEPFELPPDFSVDDYAQGQFGLWRLDGVPVAAVIDFDPTIAGQISARRFHPSQRTEALASGGVRVHLAVGDSSELASWVVGFGPLAVVREPEALRVQVAETFAAALARYQPVNPQAKP